MNNEEIRKTLLSNLCKFVDRVINGEYAISDTEIRILPEIAKLIVELTFSPESYD